MSSVWEISHICWELTAMEKVNNYDVLFEMNDGFEQAVRAIRKLQDLGIFAPQFAEIRRLATEQIRAETNRRVHEILQESEARDASRFEQERIKREKELES